MSDIGHLGGAPASQLPEPDTAAKLSDRGRGGQQLSATAPEASTRQAGIASGDPSPSPTSPLRLRTRPRIKSDSFGSAAVHRRKHSNNTESGADNRRVAIVPLRVDAAQARPVAAREDDETDRYTPSIADAAQATLPSPSAGRRGFVVDAQLAASGSALVAPPDTNLSSHDFYFSSPSLTPSPPSSPPLSPPQLPSSPAHPPPQSRKLPARRAL
ncbi:hypothetical protein BC826DRAFT_1105861 [Russula brevipes]|nr:hypothetical protein BC826DRAFT_1105861 [Russula brevipes]